MFMFDYIDSVHESLKVVEVGGVGECFVGEDLGEILEVVKHSETSLTDFGLICGVCGVPFWVFNDCVSKEVIGVVVDESLTDKVIFWDDLVVKILNPVMIEFVGWERR